MLTIYIPTFNRGQRLSENLKLVMDEIIDFGLESMVSILVGDNSSEDETQYICCKASETALQKGITFNHFRNESNLGFQGNIKAGYLKVAQGWIMFLSDDDVLYPGALKQITNDLTIHKPDVALYNFDQSPYDRQNPLITENVIRVGPHDFSQLATLFSWQKLTGVVLRSRKPVESDEFIGALLSEAKHYPHVILAILRYQTGDVLYKSNFFVAKPDLDYLEHINFLWYTSESLVYELRSCIRVLEINDPSLNEEILKLPRVSVIESSVTHLILYYAGFARITPSVKKILWDNVVRFLTFRRMSRDGFELKSHSLKFYFKLLALALTFPASFTLLPILGRRRKLMHEGF